VPADSREVTVLCRAKLNLVLEILGRRPDGYHDLATVMHPIGLADRLHVRAGGPGIALRTSGLAVPQGRENIVARAAGLFYELIGQPPAVDIALEKNIPPASGLGGGSADAAGILVALAERHGLPAEGEGLGELAVRLGADVPFFLSAGAALAEGIGERLVSLPAGRFSVVLALGRPGVETAWAYSQVSPDRYTDGARAREAAAALAAGGPVVQPWNAFAHALALARPDLGELTAQLAGLAQGPACLTGSGSCAFALAADGAAADRACEAMRERGYWAWSGPAADRPLAYEVL